MSIFDRIGNIGKGVGKVWARNAKEAFDRLQSGSPDWDDDGDATADPRERKLRLLEKMRDEGLLSESEYRDKRSDVLGVRTKPEDKPRRRTRSLDPAPEATEPEQAEPAATKNDKPRKRNL